MNIKTSAFFMLFCAAAGWSQANAQTSSDSTELSVRCSAYRSHTIYQDKETSLWCGADADGFCFKRKNAAAKSVCGTRYKVAVAKNKANVTSTDNSSIAKTSNTLKNNNTAAASNTSQAQQIALELELLEIQQQKLDLKKKQLDLIKEEKRLKSKYN